MARPEFENQTLISATTNKKIRMLYLSSNTALGNLVYESLTFYSPAKTVSSVVNLAQVYYDMVGQGTGNKNLICNVKGTRGIGIYSIQGVCANLVKYDQSSPQGTNYTMPADLGAIGTLIRDVTFDDTIGLEFQFRHDAGVSKTELREVVLFVIEEVVAR